VTSEADEEFHEEREGRKAREEKSLSPSIESLATLIVDAGLKVHRALGPGLLESTYERCLAHELNLRGIGVQQQVTMPLIYEGARIEGAFRLDLVAAGAIIIEVKAIEKLLPLHDSQVLTYLKFSPYKLAFLMNFNTRLFKDGLKRFKS
jgi:GxxExxY protein